MVVNTKLKTPRKFIENPIPKQDTTMHKNAFKTFNITFFYFYFTSMYVIIRKSFQKSIHFFKKCQEIYNTSTQLFIIF